MCLHREGGLPVGEYTMTVMAAHLLAAITAGNEVKTYPKFYLSTIVNDVN